MPASRSSPSSSATDSSVVSFQGHRSSAHVRSDHARDLAAAPARRWTRERASRSLFVVANATKYKVLILDDSEITTEVAQEALQHEGFEVRACTTLGEVTAILKHWLPDVVLTDVNMPAMSGAELCHWIKTSGESLAVSVVLFSDMPEDELAILATTSGADGFISKARGIDMLRERLCSFCEETLS